MARRVLGKDHQLTIKMRWLHAATLCENEDATLDNLREAVTTLEETLQTARRVLGDGHPMRERIVCCLQTALSHLHDAVDKLAKIERTSRRVLGSAHPVTAGIEVELRDARAELSRARRRFTASETPSPRGLLLRPLPALAVNDGLDADMDDVLAS